jgi:hypothetical protein
MQTVSFKAYQHKFDLAFTLALDRRFIIHQIDSKAALNGCHEVKETNWSSIFGTNQLINVLSEERKK